MSRFDVWAPHATDVAVEVDGRRVDMRAAGDGWWRVDDESAEPGDRYWLLVDGDRLADPRSPYQPDGVHGPSCVVDHAAFAWTDEAWAGRPLAGSVLYELHVGTFAPEGTFAGVASKLDHLVDLGVTTVELMPVAEFPGARGWGYDGVHLYAPHHAYGGPDGLKRLVDACHGRGLAVFLDVVCNHLGPDGNVLGRYGPYFTDRYRTPWGEAVNFDGPDSGPVRRFFVENALSWLRDYHVDGLRLDAVHAIYDVSAVHILEELAEEVDALSAELGRHLTLVAETDRNDPRVVRSREAGGYGIHAQWSDDVHHALHVALTGEPDGYYADFGRVADVAKALRDAYVYDGRWSAYRRRRHGRPPTGLPGDRFVAFLQNHDQVGNRARGERLSALVEVGALKVAAALLLTSPYVPLLFQGEEWAASSPFLYFTEHRDEELAAAVSEGRRREFAAFGWRPEDVPDPQAESSFTASRLDWSEPARQPHAEVLGWYRRLVALRRSTPWLVDGRRERVRTAFDERARWVVVERGPVTVAANLATEARPVPVAPGRPAHALLASDGGADVADGSVCLPPASVVVLGPPDGSLSPQPGMHRA